MTDAEKLLVASENVREAVRGSVRALFDHMDDMDIVFHPWVVNDACRMAELLGIDPTTVPTEGRELAKAYGKPSLKDITVVLVGSTKITRAYPADDAIFKLPNEKMVRKVVADCLRDCLREFERSQG